MNLLFVLEIIQNQLERQNITQGEYQADYIRFLKRKYYKSTYELHIFFVNVMFYIVYHTDARKIIFLT